MEFGNADYLRDPSLDAEKPQETDKKKKLSEMSNDEKIAHYDAEIERLKEKIKQTEAKRDKVGNVTESQRNHALILFASHFISREQLYEWYQLKPKERDQRIKDYALEVKAKAGI